MVVLGDDELGSIFSKVTDRNDRNSISEVCKQWLRVEGFTRSSLRVIEPNLMPSFLPRFQCLLKLESSSWLTNREIEFVVRTCPNLQILNLNFRYNRHLCDRMGGNLSSKDFDDAALCLVAAGCRKLSKVSLRNRKRIGDLGVMNLLQNLRYLVCLNLFGCNNVTDLSLKAMGETCSIRSLDLQRCSLITDQGLACLVSGSLSKSLEKLVIAECDRITDNGVCYLQKLESLVELNLADCGPRITDIGGKAIANIKTLKRLNLSWLINIRNVTLIEVAWKCENLVEIIVTGCEDMTGDGIRAFVSHKCLESLVMASCYNVLVEDIQHLVLGCQSLKHLGLDRRLNSWMPELLQEHLSSFCRLTWM